LFWEYPDGASKEDAAALKARDILLRSRGRIDHLKDPLPPLNHIVPNAKKQDLMLLYNLPAFADNDVNAFLNGVARSNNLLKKTAEPDQILAARIVLRDWNTGRFPRFTLPPSSPSTTSAPSDTSLVKVYGQDDGVLSRLKTRSEFRKSGGLVKMNPGEVGRRTLILDAGWAAPEDSEPSEDEDDDEEVVDFYGSDGDDEEEEDEDEESDDEGGEETDDEELEDESEDELPLPPSTRKRPGGALKGSTAPPKKRVAFDLQESVKVTGLPRGSAPPKPNLKKRR